MQIDQVTSFVDARGLVCPMPTIRLGQAIRKVDRGQLVEVWSDDPGSTQNMAAWCRNTGHELVGQSADDDTFKFVVRRRR